MTPWRRLLVVVAVDAEREAVLAGLGADQRHIVVLAGGVGAAVAAANTARTLALAQPGFDTVISAGIAGGFPGQAMIGTTVIGARAVAADLGADSPDGFQSIDNLGFGASTVDSDRALIDALRRALPGAAVGDILTVSTVTGTTAGLAAIVARHPAALAEAMEGYGVAVAAAQAGAAFAEIRTISNVVGPRDRAAWRIGEALDALRQVGAAIVSLAE